MSQRNRMILKCLRGQKVTWNGSDRPMVCCGL